MTTVLKGKAAHAFAEMLAVCKGRARSCVCNGTGVIREAFEAFRVISKADEDARVESFPRGLGVNRKPCEVCADIRSAIAAAEAA